MRQENAYKIKFIKLLEILRQDSDEDHYIGTSELIEKLDKMGIVCDRRTLYKDIEVLNSFGYEVLCEKSPGKPNCYCVADRSFDVPELRILMDVVQASSFNVYFPVIRSAISIPPWTDPLYNLIDEHRRILEQMIEMGVQEAETLIYNKYFSGNYSRSEFDKALENRRKNIKEFTEIKLME